MFDAVHGPADRERLARVSVLIAGVGNIGSHLAPLILQTGVGLVRLVDRDRVEEKNLAAQDFRPGDVGRPKAETLAGRLRERFPGQAIEARTCDLEDLPAGTAAVDLVLGALDSRRARQVLASDFAWPLGVPLIDGGVGEGLVGRVQVFVPGPATACLECTWGQADYRQLSREYPCVPGADAVAPPTAAPAFLGSLVAALMTCEAVRLLTGQGASESYELPFDLWHGQLRRYELRRNRTCRHDHEVVAEVLPLAGGVTATGGDLLRLIESRSGTGALSLEVRRGLGGNGLLGAARLLTPATLRERHGERLAALGFVPGDRVRVRGPGGSVFIAVNG